MFRSEHDALLQQYRNKLENSLNTYKSIPQAVELRDQQDVLTKLYSQLREAEAQRDAAQHELSERCRQGLRSSFVCCLSERCMLSMINIFFKVPRFLLLNQFDTVKY